MHRVELKVNYWYVVIQSVSPVPNVPCGVESREMKYFRPFTPQFLMYRVELKVLNACGIGLMKLVPNVPCGVESLVEGEQKQ